jgi:hypothetical protein
MDFSSQLKALLDGTVTAAGVTEWWKLKACKLELKQIQETSVKLWLLRYLANECSLNEDGVPPTSLAVIQGGRRKKKSSAKPTELLSSRAD